MIGGMPPAKWTLAIIATLVSSAVSVLSVHAQSQPVDPQHVVQAFQLAIAAGDVEAALAQFADDAVVTVQARSSRSYTGKDQVRAYLQTTALQLRTLTRSTPIVQGGIVTWSERDQFQREAFAFDVSILATVRSSRITSLVYRQGTSTNGPSAAAEPAPMQLPSLTWPAAM